MDNNANNFENLNNNQNIPQPLNNNPSNDIVTVNNNGINPNTLAPTIDNNTVATNQTSIPNSGITNSEVVPNTPNIEVPSNQTNVTVTENIEPSVENNVEVQATVPTTETEPKKEENQGTNDNMTIDLDKKEPETEELSPLEKKKKNQKLILIILIIVSVAIVGISAWSMLNKKEEEMEYEEPSEILSKEEAESLIKDKISKVIKVYEDKEEVFEVENTEEDYVSVTNYDSVIKQLFSEKGIKELEGIKFEKKKFVVKDDTQVKMLNEIPEENKYEKSTVSLAKTNVKKDEITSEVTLSTYAMKEDVLTYYVFVKTIKLVKNEEEWLVDSFYYVNK